MKYHGSRRTGKKFYEESVRRSIILTGEHIHTASIEGVECPNGYCETDENGFVLKPTKGVLRK